MANFKDCLDKIGEIGEVQSMTESTAVVSGLPGITPNEIVIFENGQVGQAMYLSESWIEVLLLSNLPVVIGEKVTRTGEKIAIPVGKELLGCVISPLGELISGSKITGQLNKFPLNTDSLGIEKRASVSQSLETGVSLIDTLIPLGKGQRELIIGDRKTGKTSILLQILCYQAQKGMICIYTAIGRRRSEIKEIEKFFTDKGVMKNIIIINSSAEDPAGLIYLAPYTGCAIAEYFRDQGIDTIVALDDMTTHAKFYREICLLTKRFPGRDSYPVDIFFAHARMLEKGGNFKKGTKETSLTIIPVIQTPNGDLSGYIQTNLMSMTDGHIYFDSDLFVSGKRPAINPFLSVSRVGRQTQTALKREISREVMSFLSNYEKMQTFVHFGAELTDQTRMVLQRGEKIYSLFEQSPKQSIVSNLSIYLLALIWADHWVDVGPDQLKHEFTEIIKKYGDSTEYAQKVDRLIESCSHFKQLIDKAGKENL